MSSGNGLKIVNCTWRNGRIFADIGEIMQMSTEKWRKSLISLGYRVLGELAKLLG